MDKLRPVLRRDFPDFEPQHVFEAALPVYFVRLSVEVLEPQELTSFQAYMLHAIALEVNTPQEIAHLLGVDPRDITAPGTGLLHKAKSWSVSLQCAHANSYPVRGEDI